MSARRTARPTRNQRHAIMLLAGGVLILGAFLGTFYFIISVVLFVFAWWCVAE